MNKKVKKYHQQKITDAIQKYMDVNSKNIWHQPVYGNIGFAVLIAEKQRKLIECKEVR